MKEFGKRTLPSEYFVVFSEPKFEGLYLVLSFKYIYLNKF